MYNLLDTALTCVNEPLITNATHETLELSLEHVEAKRKAAKRYERKLAERKAHHLVIVAKTIASLINQ